MKHCFRCAGKGEVYKIGGGYSQANCGGKKVKCPLCVGEGKIDIPVAKVQISKSKKKGVKRAAS